MLNCDNLEPYGWFLSHGSYPDFQNLEIQVTRLVPNIQGHGALGLDYTN